MNPFSGDISRLIFRALATENVGEVTLDGRSLKVLLELDGKKTVFEVAKRLGISVNQVREVLESLYKRALIELAEDSIPFVDGEFMAYLKGQLSMLIGPLASLIIEETVESLGERLDRFPVSGLAELIEALSNEIPREDKKMVFKRAMLNKIKEKGYQI